MNEFAPNDAARFSTQKLADASRTKNTSLWLAWAITIIGFLLLSFFSLALADYWFVLPAALRTTGALVILILAIAGACRLVRILRRPARIKDAALDLESQRPELGCEVSTAAEYLAGERQITRQYELELVAALETKAARALSGPAVPYELKLVRPTALLGLAVLALLIFVVAAPVAFTALKRVVLPLSKTHYTSVLVMPGNLEVPVGRDVTITNVFTGRPPKKPQLHWQDQSHPAWQTIALSKSSNETYIHVFRELRSDVRYRVTANDAVSDDFEFKTYVPPEVKDLNIRIDRPEYTKLKPVVQKSPDIQALRASTVQLRLEPTVKLTKARLRFSALPEALALAENQDGSWSGSLSITTNTDYWIELTDTRSHLGGTETPHHIKAIPDLPPKVEITDPGQDTRAAATNKVPVKLSVTDDYGVTEMRVVFHKLGGPEQVVTVQRESETNGEITAEAELDLATLNLRDYELVAYHAEAKDNNTLDGPGIGKSPVYFIEVTNEEGSPAKSQGQGQRVNLLVIQKQIIADTTALEAKASSDKFNQLADRQRDATDFGRTYLDALASSGAPAGAVSDMESAIKAMEKASGFLAGQQRAEALPAEEDALARLYQVLKQIPELQNLPTQPTQADQKPPANERLRVVLEAIKKKMKEMPENQAIQEALQIAEQLARAQEGVNAANRKSENAAGQQPGENPAANQKGSQGKSGKDGSGKGGQGESGDGSSEKAGNADSAQLAEKESQLSREASDLADKLQRMAGRDQRLGHNAGQNAGQASEQMAAAAQALRQGNSSAAGTQGMQGELSLLKLVAQLERILQDRPQLTDVVNEEFPKEYGELISEYLKKLSHAE